MVTQSVTPFSHSGEVQVLMAMRPATAPGPAGTPKILWILPAALAPYAVHWLTVTGHGLALALGLVMTQVVLGLVAMRLRLHGAWPLLIAPLVGAAILLGARAGPLANTLPIALLTLSGASHAMIFGGLCLVFASSLRTGKDDVVTGLARRLDPGWSPAMAGYTRGVTRAWVAFFAGQVAASALLLLLGSRQAWSAFINICDLPLVAAMFLGELLWRRHCFPGRPHVGPAQVIAAWRRGAA